MLRRSLVGKARASLFLGLDPRRYPAENLIHYPVIAIRPRPIDSKEIQLAFQQIAAHSHLLFTSKSAVDIFFDFLSTFSIALDSLSTCELIAVGQMTARRLAERGLSPALCPQNETAEGLTSLLDTLDLAAASLFWPHSAKSRPVIADYCHSRNIRLTDLVVYDTVNLSPLPKPSLDDVDEIVFTSPSTVDGFLLAFGALPKNKHLVCIGPVTEAYLSKKC